MTHLGSVLLGVLAGATGGLPASAGHPLADKPPVAPAISAPAGGEKGAVIEPHKDHLDLMVRGKLVGRYHVAPAQAKPYLWPLNAPNGMALTRAWPMEPAPA